MKLSEELKDVDKAVYYGKDLAGYSDRAKKLEDTLEMVIVFLLREAHINTPSLTGKMIDDIKKALCETAEIEGLLDFVRDILPGEWRCKRCKEKVDMARKRCGCKTRPSPWYQVKTEADQTEVKI